MMDILVITYDYPDDKRSDYSFVKQLVDSFCQLGHNCQVIAPYNVTKNKRLYKTVEVQKIGNNHITVYRPRYITFSNIRIAGKEISKELRKRALMRGFRMLKRTPDVIYCHFWKQAIDSMEYAEQNHLPLFVATGESDISSMLPATFSLEQLKKNVNGVICVSTKNKDESISLGLTEESKCIVAPNAINNNLFRLLNKKECRRKLGVPNMAFVICFVGWFNERKGSVRLSDAISSLEDEVSSLFIGEGDCPPTCKGILYKGPVRHDEIPTFLNAADVFVLPTLKEGCCNAIVEAMACGLPIVSSDLPFNYDVLDHSNSILIDPTDIKQISMAISTLKANTDMRATLAEGALKTASSLTIGMRASKILNFIESRL